MDKTKAYFFLAILFLAVAGCGDPVVAPGNGVEENITFVEQPRDLSLLGSDGSSLQATLYPNNRSDEGVLLVSASHDEWISEIPVIQEEYEVIFLDESMVHGVEDVKEYMRSRREHQSVVIVSHDVELHESIGEHIFIVSVSAEAALEKIKGFINNQ